MGAQLAIKSIEEERKKVEGKKKKTDRHVAWPFPPTFSQECLFALIKWQDQEVVKNSLVNLSVLHLSSLNRCLFFRLQKEMIGTKIETIKIATRRFLFCRKEKEKKSKQTEEQIVRVYQRIKWMKMKSLEVGEEAVVRMLSWAHA